MQGEKTEKKKKNQTTLGILKCQCWTQKIIFVLGTRCLHSRCLHYPHAVTIGYAELIEYLLFKQYTFRKKNIFLNG